MERGLTAAERARLDRTVVVGTSASGKTTFARALALALDAPHVELDALHWGPRWTERPAADFRADVTAAVAAPRWVVDGNYHAVRDLVWPRASTVVWLDFPFRVVFRRALVRTFGRIATQEELFAGNRESLRVTLSWDGIPLWVLRTYHRRRREMPVLLALPEHGHLAVIRLARPADADAFLAEVTVAATAARD